MNVYNSVCLSGGGVQGFQVLGVLSSISENSYFSVNEFIGTSVGSMICYLLSIRYTPMEILTELKAIDNELKNLVETAPFYQHKVENLISRRNLLDDVLLERQTRSI